MLLGYVGVYMYVGMCISMCMYILFVCVYISGVTCANCHGLQKCVLFAFWRGKSQGIRPVHHMWYTHYVLVYTCTYMSMYMNIRVHGCICIYV